ncbi:MAG: hypothetical protein AMS27_07495 [Bacteroides sp. SM23_62_1]|nr:MAG: hypothetical protein AMS27_07495 [Bacteroides sp. SM23_62_1]
MECWYIGIFGILYHNMFTFNMFAFSPILPDNEHSNTHFPPTNKPIYQYTIIPIQIFFIFPQQKD